MSGIRFVAIGDSFTEGVGDELPDGRVRGWADLVAEGWARSLGEPIDYANLAIRGKLIGPIIEQQLEPALALKPTHLSFNGGGNDILRPRADVARIVGLFDHVLRRCDEEGVTLVLLSGANPTGQLPMGAVMRKRGDLMSHIVEARIADRPDVIRAFNWFDEELATPSYWSEDRLHMNPRGHHRVAARVLEAVGATAPEGWWSLPELPDAVRLRGMGYYREHVGPWVRRRLTGTSSGDGREPKFGGGWTTVQPA
ncbi:SGNH/GDSL hydrolase family protein [Protaetiibacter sp. SSC-01]|nr:SGNH/GDSL hydrolase family protein [Protaetiibacter sp. SSC-01]QNO37386.1 SGNH/GDSL hydrolase family protein [Protaetiibacter sp. SSC-01]